MKASYNKFLHIVLLAFLLVGTVVSIVEPTSAQDSSTASEETPVVSDELTPEPVVEPETQETPIPELTPEPGEPEPTEVAQPTVTEGDPPAIDPSIALSKSKGAVGTSVELAIAGFAPESEATVRWDGMELASAQTDGAGHAVLTVKVPATTNGVHEIVVSVSGIEQGAEFTVTARTAVNPKSGPVGQMVKITLTGFGKSEKVGINFGATTVKNVTASRTGGWSGSVIVPEGAPAGRLTVKASGDAGNRSSTVFTVEAGEQSIASTDSTVSASAVTGSLRISTTNSSNASISGACFTLYQSVSGKRGAVIAEACDASDGSNGITNFSSLTPGTVIVAESSSPDGFLPAADVSTTIVANQQRALTVVNQTNTNLTILNFDESGSPLEGSCYIIYTDIGGGNLGSLVASACDDDDDSEDGVVHFGQLSSGNRILVEKVVPRGYARVAQQTFVHDSSKPKAISVQHETGGAIVVTKINDLGDPVNGACFDAYIDLGGGALGNFVDRGCNPDGSTIVIDGLKVGNYFLVESKAPYGYKKASNSKFTIVAKTDVAVTVTDLPTTKVVVRKQSESERPLAGACFEVYRAKVGGGRGDRVQESKCDSSDGKSDAYLSFGLPPGDYILAETKAPGGYLRGSDTPFTIVSGLDASVTVTNVLGGTIRVTTIDETGQYANPTGACYTVWTTSAKTKKLGTACDSGDGKKDGVTSVSGLPGGTHYLQQSTIPWGYFGGSNFTVDVTIRKTTNVEYYNEPWPLLIINKVDENGDPLGGACFTAFVDKGGGVRGTEWKSPDGPLCDTDKDGILYALVTPGNQILVETKSPIGYMPVQDTPFVMIRGDVTELTVENYRVGFVYITKKSLAGVKLTGACFEAYHNANGKRGAKAASGCDRQTGSGSFNKTLDAITILNGLEPGEYWIAEKTAPAGYFKAADVLIEVAIAKTEVTIFDEPWPTFTVTKVDDTGTAVKGACFQLFKIRDGKRGASATGKFCSKNSNVIRIGAEPGTYLLAEVTIPKGYVQGKDIQVTIKRGLNDGVVFVNYPVGYIKVTNLREGDKPLTGSCWELWTDVSNKPGKKVVRGCDSKSNSTPGIKKLEAPPGKYILIQASTPSGYKTASNLKVTIVARQTLSVTVKNAPYPRFVVNSVDGANKPLAGACFDLYVDAGDNKLGKRVASSLCDKGDQHDDGTTSRRLAPGRYVARQVTTPSGFAKAPDFKFTIVENTDLVLTLQHQLAGTLVVNTKDRASLILPGACYELWTKLSNGKKGVLVAKACDKESSDSSSKLDGSTKLRVLPPGQYLLVQSFAKSGYARAADSTVTVLGGSTTTVTVINDKS